MNPPPYTALAPLLRHRLAVIADHELRDRDPDAHLIALRDASLAISEAGENLAGTLPPRLAHFLERASYDKALAFIEAEQRPSE